MITPEQREARKSYLGSSDMAAILGLDLWGNASDVFLEKTDQLEPRPDEGSGVQTIGNSFESAVIDLFEQKRGVIASRNIFLTYEMFCCNLDGLIESEHEVVEAKTTGKVEEWGEQFTDDVPERVLVQTHEQMYVVTKATGKECRIAWIPVLLPGYQHLEFRIYRVERNDDLMGSIIDGGTQFWNNHILPKIPPDIFQPSMELLKRVKRVPEKIVAVSDSLVVDWIAASEEEKRVKKIADSAKSALIASLGDAEGGEYSEGMVTYYSQNRAGYTVEPTSYRVLRKPKGKK